MTDSSPLNTLSPAERASAAATRLFVGLTPDRVLAAAEAAGLAPTGLCYPLNSFENRVYEIEGCAAGGGGRARYVAKFYRPGRWSREQILEEHRFLAELAAEEVPVRPPRPFPDGDTLKEVAAPLPEQAAGPRAGEPPDGILYAVWDRLGGRSPDELDGHGAARLGRLAARIHLVGARSAAGPRLALEASRYVRRPLAWMLAGEAIPAACRDRYAAAARAIAEIYEERAAGMPLLRIHADLHLGNLLVRDSLLWAVDFDDFGMGPAVQDLWLAIPGRDAASLALVETMLAAYQTLRDFDRSTLALVEPLRGLRMVRYTGWLARRWHDPAFKTAWPQFGTAQWWRDTTADLEDQLRAIRGDAAQVRVFVSGGDGHGGPGARPEDPSALTNKDYFWDFEG